MAENRVIGRDGGLPWRLPNDMRRFKQLTMGHPVVMGRRTFETLAAPLTGRRNIVVSRSPSYRPGGAEVVASFEAALALAAGAAEVFVAGGEQVYRLALPHAHRIYLTVVHAELEGDARFPPLDSGDWRLVEDVRHTRDANHAYAYSFQRFERAR
jgi:dihydrofolate reductase